MPLLVEPARASGVLRAALAEAQKAKWQRDKLGLGEALETDVVSWITKRFFVPELGGPMTLADYQADVLRQAFTPGPDGHLPYSTIVWSDIKKSSKSTIAAAVCLWWADTHPWSSIRIVANDLKQADSREAEYARRAVILNPGYFVQQRGARVTGYNIRLGNRSRIEAVPIDPKGEAGGGDDIIVFTELWAAKSAAALQMWTECTLSPLKFGQSVRWVETYAGFEGDSPLLEGLYRQGVEEGARIRDDYELYENRPARLLCLWNTEPKLPWQTPEYYAQESSILLESEFLRVHRNRWAAPSSAFVPAEWWNACLDPITPKVGSRVPVILGVDASVSGDCTALVAVARHPERHDEVVQFVCRVWVPPADGKMDYRTTLTPAVDELLAQHNVVQVAYDEYQLHHWATEQRSKVPSAWYQPFGQGADRLVADKGLYDLIRDRRLHQNGDPVLREHIQACAAKVAVDEDNRLRLVKRNQGSKIDAAVGLSMACYECLRLML